MTRLLLLALGLCLALADLGHAAIRSTLQSAVSATGNGTVMSVDDKGSVGVTVTGTFTATVGFEGSADGGTTWASLRCVKLGTLTVGATTTTTGTFTCNVAGLSHFRTPITWTSGTSVTVVGQSSVARGFDEVTLGTLLACEDQNAQICKIEQRFASSGTKTADALISNGAGYVDSMVCYGTDNAATAGTIILYDNTAESGTVIHSWTIAALDYHIPIPIPIHYVAGTGVYLGYTTTNDVNCTLFGRFQ